MANFDFPEESLLWTAQWYNEYFKKSNVYDISLEQIKNMRI